MIDVLKKYQQTLRAEIGVLDDEARVLRQMRLDLAKRRFGTEEKLRLLKEMEADFKSVGGEVQAP